MSKIVNEREQMLSHLAAGNSVIMESCAVYCESTGKLIGSSLRVVSVHDTPDKARRAYADSNGAASSDDNRAIFVKHPKHPLHRYAYGAWPNHDQCAVCKERLGYGEHDESIISDGYKVSR